VRAFVLPGILALRLEAGGESRTELSNSSQQKTQTATTTTTFKGAMQ